MKIYHDRDISLIYNGVNRYWTYNGAWHKYDIYSVIKQFKHSNPSEFRKRFRYDALGKRNKPLCYYGKCKVAAPRKFIFTLKRFSLAYSVMYKKRDNTVKEYACMRKKLCTDYYLPIYNVGKQDQMYI